MNEPTIIGYGRSFVGAYTPAEYEEALRSAFVRGGANFIVLDSNPHGQRFLAAGAAWAIDKGWLYCDRTNEDDRDAQTIVASFRLTPAGRAALGLPGQ